MSKPRPEDKKTGKESLMKLSSPKASPTNSPLQQRKKEKKERKDAQKQKDMLQRHGVANAMTNMQSDSEKKNMKIFGVELVELSERDKRMIPQAVEEAIKWCLENIRSQSRMFKRDAEETKVARLILRLEKGDCKSLFEERGLSASVVTAFLLEFIRAVPRTLLSVDLCSNFVMEKGEVDVAGLGKALSLLPRPVLALLRVLFSMMSLFVDTPTQQISPEEFSAIFAPLLLRDSSTNSRRIVSQIIRCWKMLVCELDELEHNRTRDNDREASQLLAWLRELGMAKKFDLLTKVNVTPEKLQSMVVSDLLNIGVPAEEALALLNCARKGGVVDLEPWDGKGLDPRVHDFLVSVGVTEFIATFEEYQIDWTVLDLSAACDFSELGIDDLSVKKIMHALGKRAGGLDQVEDRVRSDEYTLDPKWKVDLREIRVQKKIGIGGFAEVWRAIYRENVVAFKLLQEETMDDLKVVKEFRQEMAVMSSLDHPNIVKFFGFVEQGKSLAMILEYASRGDLEGILLERSGSITYVQRLLWAKQVAQGLQYLHTRNPRIIHRDIKSANVLVDVLLCTKLCDFGLAKRNRMNQMPSIAMETSEVASKRLNLKSVLIQFTSLVGTPAWTAPELLANRAYTEKVDVYSYGIFLWELMCRQTPHEGMSPFDMAYEILSKDLRPTIPEWMPETFRQLMQSCWSKKEEYRPNTDQVLKILANMLAQPKHENSVKLPY